MNQKTIEFHMVNIAKNNRFTSHKKEVEAEISSLRLVAAKFKNSNLGILAENKANEIQALLDKAILKRISI